jgi:predicted phage-related endonuclease
MKNYDHWKSTNPADELLGPEPRPERALPIERIERHPIESREQWLALRRGDITASDVAAVCGEGMFGSPATVYAEKKGLVPAREQTEAMKRGLWGEAAVFEALASEYSEWSLRRGKVYLRDPKARLGATPDGAALISGRPGMAIVQAKVVSKSVFASKWLDNGGDPHDPHAAATVPLGYQLQVLTEAMLADSPSPIIAALVIDEWRWSLRVFDVPRNPAVEQKIRERVAQFWREHLDPGIPPPLDPARDQELVRLLWPADDGSTIDLSGDNALPMIVDCLEELKATIKQSTDEKTTIETDLKARLGSHSYAIMNDGRTISYKLQHRSAYSVPAGEHRVLRIGKQKGGHIR